MGWEANAGDVDVAQRNAGSVAHVTPVMLGWRPLAQIFVAALALRGIVVYELSQTPFFSSLLGDSLGYHVWAEGLAAGDWLGTEIFYQAPLYPYLLGLLYSVVGPDALWVKLSQIVLEAISCVLLAGAGARFFGSARVGILTGLIAGFYAPTIFFTTIVQKATLGFFLTSVVLNLLSRVFQIVRSPSLLALLGFSLGLLALTRENALIFILLIVPWLALKYRRVPSRTLAGWIALLVLGASIPLLSVGLRNHFVGGDFTLTTSQFGTNFYIGNNANAKGFYLPLDFYRGNVKYERDDAAMMAESLTGENLSATEVSRFWTGMALDYIRDNPMDWLGLMLRKTALVWNRVEAADTEDIAAYRDYSKLLDALARVFHFGIMVPLAAAGIWLTRSRWRELWLLYAMMAAYAASLSLFFLFARYRVPLIPPILMFSAAGVNELRRLVWSQDRRAQLQTGLVVACAALIANLPLTDTDTQLAATYKNFGAAMIDADKLPEAVEFFGKSLRYRPDVIETRLGMAESLADLGRFPESRQHFERLLELEPDHFLANLELGRVHLLEGHIDEGIQRLELAAELEPNNSQPYYFLGLHYADEKDYPQAVQWLRAASMRETNSHIARFNLAKTFYLSGETTEAEEAAVWILRRDPSHVETTLLLASIVAERGQLKRARSLYLRVLEHQPANPRARKRVVRIEREIQLRNRIQGP